MLAVALTIMLGTAETSHLRAPAYVGRINETQAPSPLKDVLQSKLKEMSEAEHGVFHDDVTTIVAAYFPNGLSISDTEKKLADQKLGSLRRFHGKEATPGMAIYVSHSELASEPFSDVYVVIDFEFVENAGRVQTLSKVKAYLQASSM